MATLIKVWQNIKKIDWLLLLPVLMLSLFGLASLYTNALNSTEHNWTLFNKQLIFFIAGLILLFIFSHINYKKWQAYSLIFYILSLFLLIAVFFWGTTIRGTTGWFYILGFGFQPVELMKFALVFILSNIYSNQLGQEKDKKTILKVSLVTLLPVGMAMLQPDFGSAAVLLSIGFGFYLLLSMRLKDLAYIGLIIILVAGVLWNFILLDYQKNRIMIFLNPMRDPLGKGYNIRQSIIAVGSGKLLGRGLGLGSQSQLHFLPETATDFIFAAIAETLGFLGSSLIIMFFLLLFFRLIMVMRKSKDLFATYIIYGFGLIFFIQSVINIGMNIGMLPIVGLSLPFVSYGGSFLIICLIAIGIIENIILRQKTV